MNYRESIDWLFSTQTFGIKLGLGGARLLLREFLAFPASGVRVIQVAGTNGKGSTCAMIDSLARAMGTRTGLFTSPHLVDYRERVRVSGEEISEEACADLLTRLREISERLETHPTFFEITLALAMRWFRQCECELIILETGMGGRLDATTAVPADVSVITPVGMDHTQWLGETLEEIAVEKAGIFRPGKPAVSAPQEPAARFALEKEANERRTPLEFVAEPLLGYPVNLAGPHQKWNAALAVEALHMAGYALGYDSVRYGLSKVSWPGRFERIRPDLVLDGAHNEHSAKALAETWRSEFPDRKATLVFSAVSSKNIPAILAELAPLAAGILICPVDNNRAVPPEEIAAALPAGAPPHECFPSLEAALGAALEKDGPTLVAGSLFLIGEARALLTDGCFQSSEQ